MKFIHKPTVVEAEQFYKDKPFPEGVCVCYTDEPWGSFPHVHTIHRGQAVRLEDGDWVVQEPDGIHFYPIKREVFAANYEPVLVGGMEEECSFAQLIGKP